MLGNPLAARATVGGVRFWLRPADRTASAAFWSGTYEDWWVSMLADLLAPGMTVVDAGANVGLIGLRLAARLRALGAGKVVFVEPIPANVLLLRASIALNQLRDHCTVLDVGLGDAACAVTFFAEGGARRSGNAGLCAPAERTGRLTKVRVQLRPLDDLLSELGEPRISLLKVDVEGSELAALRGAVHAIDAGRPLIFGEFYTDQMAREGSDFIDVMRLLAPLGYRSFVAIGPRHLVEFAPRPVDGKAVLGTPQALATYAPSWQIDLLA